MDRQHSAPILLKSGEPSAQLRQVPQSVEERVQDLVHRHPEALPIADIDPIFAGAIAICREMQLGNGRVDNFLITASGLPILVECKLWRNPEARRSVIGQILEYAKTLSRWSCTDLQREVGARTGGGTSALLDLVRVSAPDIEERSFLDAVSFNLRRGRFLLLIVGDGIREDVETIAAYLQAYAGLHFTFGLVEMPMYDLGHGDRIVVPRIVVRTTSIVRNVIEVPRSHVVQEPMEAAIEADSDVDADRTSLASSQQAFWDEFLSKYVKLDDASQPRPNPPKLGYLAFMMPAPQGSSWLTVYRDLHRGEVGLALSSSRNSPGEDAMRTIVDQWDDIKPLLGGTAHLTADRYGRTKITESKSFGDLNVATVRHEAFRWLAERCNIFINILRPRVRDVVAAAKEGA